MVTVADGRQQQTLCRYNDDDYRNCEINGAMNSYAGPVTFQFQTDGSNYNATTRFNQEFFGFRAYYYTGSDATNLKAMSTLLTGRVNNLLSESISSTLSKVAGLTHEYSFMCPVRNYTVFTCAKDPPCQSLCEEFYKCCAGFCVPIDEFGDPYPTTREVVMVRPELRYRLNSAVISDWTASSSRIMQFNAFPGRFTDHFNYSSSFANATLEVDLDSTLIMFHKDNIGKPVWRQNMTRTLCSLYNISLCAAYNSSNVDPDAINPDAALQLYSAFIDAFGSTNITVRKCRFRVTSNRAGFMTAAMRFDYKDPKKWPYDTDLPSILEEGWLMQPLQVQPRLCVADGSSLTMFAAGSFSTFTVHTRDRYSNPRILGGEVVNVLLISNSYSAPQQMAADVVNNGNGTYFVEYLLTKAGKYFLAINIMPLDQSAPKLVNDFISSEFNVQGSPFSIHVMSGPINVSTIAILGNMQSGAASFYLMHIVRIYDIYGNLASPNVAERLSVTVPHSLNTIPYQFPRTPSRFAAADIVALEAPGDFLLTWMPVMTGWHTMNIFLNLSNYNVHINNSPFPLFVAPAPIDASSSQGTGPLFDLSVLSASDRLVGTIILRDTLGNVRREAEFVNSNRFATSFRGIEISDCPYIQNTTLLEILKACPSLFIGNMSLSRACSSSNYLASNSKPSVINAFTLNGTVEHTLDRHDKLLAWLANTVRSNSCDQIARIAIDTASTLPRTVSPHRWTIVPPRNQITSLVNTSRKIFVTAEENEMKERVFGVSVACTAAGLYRVSVTVSNQMLQGLPHLLLVQAGSPETKLSQVYGSLLNRDRLDKPIHSGFLFAGELYDVHVFLRDRFGNFVWTGHRDMSVTLGELRGYKCPISSNCFPHSQLPNLAVSTTYATHQLIDTNDGTYVLLVRMPIPGQFDVNVFVVNGESRTVTGQSPYTVNVASGNYVLENTYVEGQGMISCGAGVICSFSVINRDKFKNLIVLPTAPATISHTCTLENCNITNGAFNAYVELFKVDELGSTVLLLSSADFKVSSEAGKAFANYKIQKAGQYSWNVLVHGRPVPGTPFRFSIFGGITSANTTIASGYGLVCAHPGFPSTFVIRTRDVFENFKTAGGDILEVGDVHSFFQQV
jgi:hypothetical protein